jgi:hypothetical protein
MKASRTRRPSGVRIGMFCRLGSFGETDEFDLPNARGDAPRRQDDAGKVRQTGKQMRGVADQLLGL